MDILKLQKMFSFVIVFQKFKKTNESYFFPELFNEWMGKPYRTHLLGSQSYHTRLFIPWAKLRGLSCGNRRHSYKIAFVNSAIFWHCGLRCFILRSIKSHRCSIGFISGNMAGHWNVSITSCCLSSLTVRAVCGLVLSFIIDWFVFNVNFKNIWTISLREQMLY